MTKRQAKAQIARRIHKLESGTPVQEKDAIRYNGIAVKVPVPPKPAPISEPEARLFAVLVKRKSIGPKEVAKTVGMTLYMARKWLDRLTHGEMLEQVTPRRWGMTSKSKKLFKKHQAWMKTGGREWIEAHIRLIRRIRRLEARAAERLQD